MDQARIREGTEDDLDQVTTLWQALVHHHMELDPRLPSITADGTIRWQERLAKSMEEPAFRLLVAEDNDREILGFITGFLRFGPDVFESHKIGKIADIFVAEQWRRRGIGMRLLAALTEWFRSEQVDSVEMSMVVRNPAAVSFWRSVGAQTYTQQMWLPIDWMETIEANE